MLYYMKIMVFLLFKKGLWSKIKMWYVILYWKERVDVLHVVKHDKTWVFDQSKLLALKNDSKYLTEQYFI